MSNQAVSATAAACVKEPELLPVSLGDFILRVTNPRRHVAPSFPGVLFEKLVLHTASSCLGFVALSSSNIW